MRLYVKYREYLTVDQLAQLLTGVDLVYEALYVIDSPAPVRQRPSRTRLRVEQAETGHSIALELVQGVHQVMDSVDPAFRGVAGGLVVLQLTGQVLINGLRKGTEAWTALRSAQLSLRSQELNVRDQELTVRNREIATEYRERALEALTLALSQVNYSGRDLNITEIAEAIGPGLEMIDAAASAETIQEVSIDGQDIKTGPG